MCGGGRILEIFNSGGDGTVVEKAFFFISY